MAEFWPSTRATWRDMLLAKAFVLSYFLLATIGSYRTAVNQTLPHVEKLAKFTNVCTNLKGHLSPEIGSSAWANRVCLPASGHQRGYFSFPKLEKSDIHPTPETF